MIGKSPIQGLKDLFQPLLREFIDMNHELVLLSQEINWKELEEGFSSLYSNTGTPAKPVRLLCGLLILKQIYNLGDRGYRGAKIIYSTQIIAPDTRKNTSPYQKQKMRNRFRRRASIEPIISHMKHQYRMLKNYFKGIAGDAINLMMSAAAFNFKSWMNKIKPKFSFAFCKIKFKIQILITFVCFNLKLTVVKD
ncbi:MAG: transposase [Bacteroidia bacterium]